MTNNTHKNHFWRTSPKNHPKNIFHRKIPTFLQQQKNGTVAFRIAGVFFRFACCTKGSVCDLRRLGRLRLAGFASPQPSDSDSVKMGFLEKAIPKKIGGFFCWTFFFFLGGGGVGRMKSIYKHFYVDACFMSEMQQFYEKKWPFMRVFSH